MTIDDSLHPFLQTSVHVKHSRPIRMIVLLSSLSCKQSTVKAMFYSHQKSTSLHNSARIWPLNKNNKSTKPVGKVASDRVTVGPVGLLITRL